MVSSPAVGPTTAPDDPLLQGLYGSTCRELPVASDRLRLVASFERPIDLVELEQLCDAVGWIRRPLRRVRRALPNHPAGVGPRRPDPRVPRRVGFAALPGVVGLVARHLARAIHPLYQRSGLGRGMMQAIVERLQIMGVERATLFADPDVVDFYRRQGWTLEPDGVRCVFWYSR